MGILPQKNNERNLIDKFFKSTDFLSSTGNRKYGNVLSILSKIFDTLGQKHLISIVKLRKLWFTEIDSFLSKNAYPRNISVLQKFTINEIFFEEIRRKKALPDLLNIFEKSKGMSFDHPEKLNSYLKKKLNRLFTTDEEEFLKNKATFRPVKTTIHLTVYDGSISQAIRFENETYIRKFNQLVPEIKLDEIKCHVGDLSQAKLDQSCVANLAKDWHLITPEKVFKKCMPAFIHRVSRRHSVLVLYVSTEEDLDLLKFNPGVDWLLKNLRKKRSDLQGVFQKIIFVLKPGLELEKIRLRSAILGSIKTENFVSNDRINYDSKSDFSKTSKNVREQFAKILLNLNQK